MKLRTTHLIWLSVALVGLSQGENVRQSVAKGNQIRQQQSEFSDRIRTNREEAKQAQKLSKVAIDRYRNNCILVTDLSTKKETYFSEGQDVIDRQLNRRIRTGATVCNRLGDTAIVDSTGAIADIARVSTDDLPTVQKILEKRKHGSL